MVSCWILKVSNKQIFLLLFPLFFCCCCFYFILFKLRSLQSRVAFLHTIFLLFCTFYYFVTFSWKFYFMSHMTHTFRLFIFIQSILNCLITQFNYSCSLTPHISCGGELPSSIGVIHCSTWNNAINWYRLLKRKKTHVLINWHQWKI